MRVATGVLFTVSLLTSFEIEAALALSATTTCTAAATTLVPTGAERGPRTEIPTGELQTLAAASSRKTPGSASYLRAWRHFSERSLDHIRSRLIANLPYPVDVDATERLSFELGMAADVGSMPSFAEDGARAGYAIDYFCRSRLLSDLLFTSKYPPSSPAKTGEQIDLSLEAPFFAELVEEFLSTKASCRLVSLGGGPGYDFVSAAVVSTYNARLSKTTKIDATVLDFEPGWSVIVDSMAVAVRLALGGEHTCDFGTCDITLPLSHNENIDCLAALGECGSDVDLWVCSYCVAENAIRLRSSDFVFFRELFNAVGDGAAFVFTETTHRLWPDLVDVALEMHGRFDVAFPRVHGRGKNNRQMVLRKRSGGNTFALGEREIQLYEHFQRDNVLHERKIQGGWVRQAKKIRGAK